MEPTFIYPCSPPTIHDPQMTGVLSYKKTLDGGAGSGSDDGRVPLCFTGCIGSFWRQLDMLPTSQQEAVLPPGEVHA